MSRDRSQTPSEKLPSLHEVLGDVLDRPASRASPRDQQQHQQQRRSVSAVMRFFEPCLIPYHQHPSSPNPNRSSTPYSQGPSSPASAYGARYASPHPHASYNAQPVPQPATAQTAPTYHLFDLTKSDGLVHRRSSTRDDLDPTIPKPRLPPSDPARKYVCSECGNRFSKQSTLRNHHLTHTGERPFACTYPGCGRRFSMACNMQRHMRTHTSASAFEHGEEDEHYSIRGGSASSRGGSTSREASVARGTSPRGAY